MGPKEKAIRSKRNNADTKSDGLPDRFCISEISVCEANKEISWFFKNLISKNHVTQSWSVETLVLKRGFQTR